MSPNALVRRLNRSTPAGAALRFVAEETLGPGAPLRRWQLANGLTVLTLEDKSAPVVGFQTWLRVGSRDEVGGKTGLAHFFEHLMFLATKNYEAGAIDELFEGAGAEHNAGTSTDWTQYYENMPAKQLELAVALESDRLANLDIRVEAMEAEREAVLSERRNYIDDDVEGKAGEVLYQRAFKKHGYGHPTLGWARDIRAYTMAECRAFYRKYYAPNNATLVVVGAIDEADTLGLIQSYYGPLKASRTAKRKAIVEPAQRRERRTQIALAASTEKLSIGYRAPGFGHPDWPVLSVLGDILFGGRSSRVYKDLVLEREWVSQLYGSLPPFEEPGLYEVWAGMRSGKSAAQALARIDAAVADVQKNDVSEPELEKAKARAELSLLLSMESISGKAEQIGFDELVLRRPAASAARIEAYRQVTQEDIRRVAQTYFVARRRTTVVVVPDS